MFKRDTVMGRMSVFGPHPTSDQVSKLVERFMHDMDTTHAFGISEACYSLHRHPLEFRVASRHNNHVSVTMSCRMDSMKRGPRIDEWIIAGNFDGRKAIEWLEDRHTEWVLMTGTEGQEKLWL